ncbi:DUF2339 domain-containing protein [Candidatus Omnitrophota bacterium]
MSQDPLQNAGMEMHSIKNALASLQKRVVQLEEKINASRQRQATQKTPPEELPKEPAPAQVAKQKPVIEKQEAFELTFGKYWLNRIGVVVFVLGIAFLFSYAIAIAGPLIKILIGYTASAAFFLLGSHLEKKKQYVRYAWGILGGAWGLLYLSTYAMYYIPQTKVITNAVLELCLLALVSVVAILYNLKYRSWVVTSLTFLLAFMTAGLGGIEYSTVVYCTLLTGGIVYLAYKLDWYKFLLIGINGVFLTYLWWLRPQILSSFAAVRVFTVPIYKFQLGFGIIGISWILFTLVLFFMKLEDGKQRLRYIVAGILCNAGYFALLGSFELSRVRRHLAFDGDVRFWFLAVAAVFYLVFAYASKRLDRSKLIVSHVGIAATFIAMAAMIQFPRLSVGFFWLLQMVILFGLGVYYREFVYRILASVLSIFIMLRLFIVDYFNVKYYAIFGLQIKHAIVMPLFGAACFFCVGALIRKKKIQQYLKSGEAVLFYIFVVFATVLLTFARFAPLRIGFIWLAELAALFAIGIYYKERLFRVLVSILSVMVILRLFFVDFGSLRYHMFFGFPLKHNIALFSVAALCFYYLGALVKNKQVRDVLVETERGLSNVYVVFATVLLTSLLAREIGARWLSLAWALEGGAILGAGFWLHHRVYRICALCIFSLAFLRVIFIDMAGINTMYKIITFIILGVVMLIASFAYSKFVSKAE